MLEEKENLKKCLRASSWKEKACTKAKFFQFFHDICPEAEYDMPVALQGLGEVIHRVGAVAVLCNGGKNPHMIKCFLNSYILNNYSCKERITAVRAIW